MKKSIVEEFSEERLNDILSPDLVSRKAYVDALNKITALEALAKQMCENIESIRLRLIAGEFISARIELEQFLDAYKRGVGKV